MLIELKRCNSIGNINGLLFLISIIAGKDKIYKDEIRNRCALENGVVVNCSGAVALLEYLGLVETDVDTVISTTELSSMVGISEKEIINRVVALSINRLLDDGIFDNDATGFDVDNGRLTIKRSAFPLEYAAIRNFLITSGALGKEENGVICVGDNFENNWIVQLGKHRKNFTLKQLLDQQEEQNRRGLEAEEFVLGLEKHRLPAMASKIKRISDFDVGAGYDIASYENDDRDKYDRFIEVKCYIGSPHFFWSENECDVAKIKGDKYILCLVDYSKISEPGYIPEYIQNPYTHVFEGNQWMINTASYRIQKI